MNLDWVQIGLAFLEGLALIASPCILPVLPLVLAASIDGGRRRPVGIIVGFVVSFSVFAIAARQLVLALGLDLDIIKNGSLILLGLFGLILLSEKLSNRFSAFTQKAANAGNNLATTQQRDGFFSGLIIGALIGLVWTPCAGPILAAVLVQIIRQQSNLSGYFMVIAFALGAGIPMLVIALTGRQLISKLAFLTQHAEAVRKGFGVLILLAVAYMAWGDRLSSLGSLTSSTVGSTNTHTSSGPLQLQDGLAQPYAAPEFANTDTWLNSKPLTMAGLKGKVVLVDFWTYSCINCVRTLPHLIDWDKKYRDQGLVIVGVHSPEFEFEKKRSNVQAAIQERGIRYPVALDNQLGTWDRFQNRYWPAHYLINRDGQIVYTHFGEGHYEITENNIRYLLGLKSGISSTPQASATDTNQTDETYLGYTRAQRFANEEPMRHDVELTYHFPQDLALHHWALQGSWKIHARHIEATQSGAQLRLHFLAGKVYLVAGSKTGKAIHLKLKLNDTDLKPITVNQQTIYELVNKPDLSAGVLDVKTDEPGLEAYALTFGK